MIKKTTDFPARRSLLAGADVAAAGFVAGTGTANAQNAGFQSARHEYDAWIGEMPGQHRVWIDASYGLGGMETLHHSKNFLNANVSVHGTSDDDYALVIC